MKASYREVAPASPPHMHHAVLTLPFIPHSLNASPLTLLAVSLSDSFLLPSNLPPSHCPTYPSSIPISLHILQSLTHLPFAPSRILPAPVYSTRYLNSLPAPLSRIHTTTLYAHSAHTYSHSCLCTPTCPCSLTLPTPTHIHVYAHLFILALTPFLSTRVVLPLLLPPCLLLFLFFSSFIVFLSLSTSFSFISSLTSVFYYPS